MNVSSNGGFPLYANLKSVCNTNNNCFPPFSTLDRELTTLAKQLTILDDLQKDVEKSGEQWDINNNYRDALLDFVESMDKLHDIAYLIIRNVSSVAGDESLANSIDWVKKYEHKKYELLKGSISKDHEWIRLVSNLKKHDDVRVGFLNMTTRSGKTVYGFFFGVIKDGVFTPNSDIHKQYKNDATAFSYNRFINQSISHLLKIIKELNKVLFNGARGDVNEHSCSGIIKIIQIAERVEQVFFPDEYKSKILTVRKNKNSYSLTFNKVNYVDKFESSGQLIMLENQGRNGYKMPYSSIIFD
ncbi:hypothetical protein HV119_05935 [Citrobacter freundii]|uniref:hypothetical protein n=1 Tax=Citrobacter freundii TaxID=546 RepID=UPI0015E5499B|nr:hypothetical protein [Citrobacter freundii]QLN88442.1 hypothetical protein HV119_05935 [Citrobacter freundii]